MNKIRAKNEKMKRQYFKLLVDREGFADKTIHAIEKAIWKYEDFSNNADYRDFDNKMAVQFIKYIKTHKNSRTGSPISLTTQYHTLRHLKAFFLWLSGQPGYKSRINIDDAKYLRLSKKENRIATSSKQPEYPTFEYVKELCHSIEPVDDIDLRDRALIAFTALTGMRDLAIVSLPIGCFNRKTLEIEQEPEKGVKTKFSKHIDTTIFQFDETLVKYVVDWYEYLVSEMHYGIKDPLFPKTKVEQAGKNDYGYIAKGIEPKFWADAGPMRKIFKERAKEAGLEYFSPHKFRHFTTAKAQESVETAEQMKAVSQNMGHDNVGTTFQSYGYIPRQRASKLIDEMDFSGKKKSKLESEDIEKIKEILENYPKNKGS